MSVSSYKDYKQTKKIPIRIERLEKKVKELSRKLEHPVPIVKLPHPSRELVKAIPIINEFDNMTSCTGMIVWGIYGTFDYN